RVCDFWCLKMQSDAWREQYLQLQRPRWDGVYVGNCQYLHKVRPGSSMTYKGSSVWISYRRYLRLLPPDPDTGELQALILQDAAPLDTALTLLLDAKGKAIHKDVKDMKESKSHLERKLAVGRYEFCDGHVKVRYTNDTGLCEIALKLGHAAQGYFSEQMEWVDYTVTRHGEDPLRFDLGRNEWGDPRNPACDHFPPLRLRRHPALEHHL
ncbi:unnamed protein product, partial [Effrenium voratum]